MVSPRQKHKLRPDLPYDPVGQCIYCGATGCELTKEHVLARGLMGTEVLPQASCKSCQRITSDFEGEIMQGPWRAFRLKNELPHNKSKKEYQAELAKGLKLRFIDWDGNVEEEMLPANDWPNHLAMLRFSWPRIMYNRTGFIPFVQRQWVCSHGPFEQLRELARRRDWADVAYDFPDPLTFSRLLAKVGHAVAAQHLGLDGFRPLARDLILGRSNDYSYLIGGQIDVEDHLPGQVSTLDLNYRQTRSDLQLIWIRIKLFADIKSPTYMAVVGEYDPSNPQHVAARSKLDLHEEWTLQPTNPYSPIPPRAPQWNGLQAKIQEELAKRS